MEKKNNKENSKNFFKVLKDKFIVAPFKYVTVFLAGAIFASGLVYAWNAVWHGTDWIQSGVVVRSEPLAESLQYLYEKTASLENRLNNINNGIQVTGIGVVERNSSVNLGTNWSIVLLEGTVASSDAAAACGYIAHINGETIAVLSGVTGGLEKFTLNNSWQCVFYDYSDYKLCAKKDGDDVFIQTGTLISLTYTTLK